VIYLGDGRSAPGNLDPGCHGEFRPHSDNPVSRAESDLVDFIWVHFYV
jgi:hypothetical protein